MGFFGELLGEFAKGAFNAMKDSTDKYKKSYDSSSDMSDEELKDRMRNSSNNFERAGYYKRYKENHPEKYGNQDN
jgi:hypothetical protein